MKKDNVKNKKNQRVEKANFRVTSAEKKKLVKEADKLGMTLSDYLRSCVIKKKNKDQFSAVDAIYIIALVTDLVRYIEERYGKYEDERLKEGVEYLWKKLC